MNEKNQWENSASQQLANECLDICADLAERNSFGENVQSNKWLNPISVRHEFATLLWESLKESVSSGDSPIVWKTIPSRKKSNVGEYALVHIDEHCYPSNTEAADDGFNKIQYTERIKNFQKTYKLYLGPRADGSYFHMSYRVFLFHVLMYDFFGNLDTCNYKQKNFSKVMSRDIVESLGVRKWYIDAEIIKSAKSSLLASSKNNKTSVISHYCDIYQKNHPITSDEIRTKYMEESYKGVCHILTEGINPALVDFIDQTDYASTE